TALVEIPEVVGLMEESRVSDERSITNFSESV
ncbi:hypothetical protein ACVWZX_002796, partial [Deinococcus sp. UYEF24]